MIYIYILYIKGEVFIINDNLSIATVPTKFIVKNNLAHIGKILFNLGIASFIIAITLILSPIAYGLFIMLYFGFMIIATIFSMGLFLMNPTFRSMWSLSLAGDTIMKIAGFGKYLLIVGVAAFIISLIFLLLDNKKSVFRIVLSIILSVIGILLILFLFLGVK